MRQLVPVLLAFALFAVISPARAAENAQQKPPVQPQNPTPPDLSKPLGIEDLIRIGLENQNTLGIAQFQLDAARARVTQARAAYYPSVAPLFEYQNSLTSIGGRATRIDQGVTSIGLRQLIFDMGKREENVAASRYAEKATVFNVLDARQAVIVNVSTAYYELLRRKELVRVAESSVQRAKTTLDATTAFVEAGTAPKKDILQAQADYDNAQVQLSVARNDVRIANTSLKSAMGLLTPLPIIVQENPLPAPPPEPDTLGAQTYITRAYQARPDLRREAEFINSDRRQVNIAKINAGFQIQADVTEGYRIDPNPGENRTFGTTFSYPLFDAGATRAAVRVAKANYEQSKKQLDLTKQNIQQDVETSYLTREESRLRFGAAQSALEAAKKNFEAATAAQKEGAGTIIDVITAQTALVTAETNAVQAIYDYYTSDARLRRATGENDPYIARGRTP
jgi:outer membrane protein